MSDDDPKRVKSPIARVPRRGRGRPPRDYRDYDPDVEVAEWAIALQAVRDISERKAIDLALVICQRASPSPPSKVPRGAASKPGILVGYKLPQEQSFSGRNRDIRRKLKAGKLRPNHDVALAIARDLFAIARLLRLIRTLGG